MRVRDLIDQLEMAAPRPILYCSKCGGEYSAHVGDYFLLPPEHVLRCCGRFLHLGIKRVVWEEA